jgi:hypothetical protein
VASSLFLLCHALVRSRYYKASVGFEVPWLRRSSSATRSCYPTVPKVLLHIASLLLEVRVASFLLGVHVASFLATCLCPSTLLPPPRKIIRVFQATKVNDLPPPLKRRGIWKGVGTGSIKRSQVVYIFESYIRSYNSKEVVLLCLYQRLEGVSNRLGRVMPPQASRESQLGSIFVVRRYGRRERDILEAFPGRVMSLV